MENPILKYGKVLDEIGSVIIKESAKLKIPENKVWNERDVVEYYSKLEKANREYSKCLGKLKSTVPPRIIAKEHLNLISSYNIFVESAKTLLESISIVPVRYDSVKLNNGIALMKQSEVFVEQACNAIVNKVKSSSI